MEKDNENRSKYLKIRLRPSEEEILDKRYKKSTFQSLSEYGRALLLGKPVTIIYRDRSMDDVLEELVKLRRELNYVGNNLNQAVRNINSAHGYADNRLWLDLLKVINGKLSPSIEKIKERIHNYADIWSQRSKAGKA
ncbi:plasmid mobilization protein [Mucilaginibacter pedocola]|uniref:Mobilization protein n=1 Tax=Mucilaginibacter pedocola TaxID=1792845 RepID=A0A1S9PH88_9SPHI|nr:hypothetical protein [Mucilaginibacter pedocola]OOQ60295.1 hypothetical protein BC343_26445 [Mucilaginibacter pedocola]